MNYTDISFKEFTKFYIKNFPGQFSYFDTPVQIYEAENLLSYNIAIPTPLLKANFNYIAFITSGKFQQQIANEVKIVSSNQALLVMQGEVSSLIGYSKNVTGFYIVFDDSILQQSKEHTYFIKLFTTAPVIQLQSKDSQFIKHLCQLIIQELNTEKTDEQIVLHLFQSLLLKLLKSSELKKGLSRQYDIAVGFRKLVYTYYLQQHPIHFYAGQLNISSNYLNRCVQHIWNKSAKRFIQEVVIVQSQQYLQDVTKPISAIAYQLNFNDPAYFGRLFKKIMGVSPQTYRLKLMHNLSQ